jgi:hypothetical protein
MMDSSMLKAAIKSFLKPLPMVKPEHLAFVDLLFDVKWTRPTMGAGSDLDRMKEDQGRMDGRCELIVMHGKLNGKWVKVAVQTEQPGMIPPAAIESLKGGVPFAPSEPIH